MDVKGIVKAWQRWVLGPWMFGFLLFAMQGYSQQSSQRLHHHVSPAVANGKAALLGALPASQKMVLAVVLPLRNQSELQSLLGELYNPSSPNYHHFLTVKEFTDAFGPTAQDYQTAIAYFQKSGFTIRATSRNRLVLDVSGTVAQVNAAFDVSMNSYRDPNGKRTFFSPDREPTLNLSIPIKHIEGLNNSSVPHPMFHVRKNVAAVANVTGSGPGGYYLGSDMRAAYYGGTLLTGAGQSVGLFEFGGYRLSDVNLTFNNAGQSYNVPINNVVLPDGASADAGSDDTEEVLDIAQTIGMAPGLSQVRVYIGTSDVDILDEMAAENICKELSVSWSWVPDDPATDDGIFQEFAAQGQSIFVASGDYGAYDPSISPYFYPAEDAYVTSVGATHLTTNYGGGPWVGETAWNDEGYGSGGGVSLDGILLPSWQQGVATWPNGGSNVLRNVPDVAMEGDNDNYYCNLGNCAGGAGGTSFAAPRWAGFMALVNQQAEEAGSSNLGFINPSIYSIGEGSSFTTDFHDVTDGNNDTANQTVWYNAVSGYDLVTGWGSPNGQNLIDALAGPVVPGFWLTTVPSTLSIYQGDSGTAIVSVTDAGGFAGNVSLTASGLPTGVTASFNPTSTSGTSQLTLTANSSATVGPATVAISGTSGTLAASTQLALTINSPQAPPPPIEEFGSVNIGATSSATTLTLTITTAATLNNIGILTRGSPNLDFTDAGGDSCTIGKRYKAGTTCTVNVAFSPKYPGTRYGAVVLTDKYGNLLASNVYLQGVGVGSQSTFNPGSETTIGSGFGSPEGVAIRGDGSIYVADYGSSTIPGAVYLETFANGSYTQTQLSCTFNTPAGVAIDGSGTIYVADPGASVVYKVTTANGTCTQTAIGTGFSQPWGVAVDGNGNVYIAAKGSHAIYKEALQPDGTYSQTTVGSGWVTPLGIAVDGSGNIYVADSGIPGVFMETPSGGSYTQTLVGRGWTAPSGIAVDSTGNIYVSNIGTALYEGGLVAAGVYKEVASGGSYIQTPISSAWISPYGLAVDGLGNVEVADALRGIYKEDLADPPQLVFANTATGSTSSDSPKVVTVSNRGTAALNFSAVSYPTDFPKASGASYGCVSSTSLSPGQNCTLNVQFQPVTSMGGSSSLPLTESVAITTNNLNSSSSQQTLSVSGTEVLPGGSLHLDVSANPSTAGSSVTFTATVAGLSGGPIPTGTVTFYNGATALSGAIALTNAVATYSTASLATGTYTISASYSGDTNYAASTSNTINESILAPAGTTPISNTNLGTVNIGSTSSSVPLTITFAQAETLGGIAVLTQGAPNQDFANASGGTCTVGTAYSANATCTVNVTFAPKYPGVRYGAVVLSDNNGNVIGTGYMNGTAIGPQTSFLPGTVTTVAMDGIGYLISAQGVAVDGNGTLYIADPGNATVDIEDSLGRGYTIGSGFTEPSGVAVDGAGNVYVADAGNHAVYKEIPSNGSYLQTMIGYGFSSPRGVAVDGFGNIYVADYGDDVTPGAIYMEAFSNGSYKQSEIAGTFITPQAIAVDAIGDLFIADAANGANGAAVYRLTPSNGTYIQNAIGFGWVTPTGVAVDGNGNVFVTDDAHDLGDGFVARETLNSDGTYTQSIASGSSSITDPVGIALDGRGNRYISDNIGGSDGSNNVGGVVYRLDFSDPPSLNFVATPYDQTSSDSPKSITVENAGNSALSFSAVGYPTDFPESSAVSSDCTAQSSIQSGASCTLSINFKPDTPLSTGQSQSLSENVTIVTNSLGASTQNLVVTGTEATPAVSVVLTTSANVFVTGATVTFTAAVTGQGGLAAPTGTVTFYSETSSGNTALGTSSLSSNGTAMYSTSSLASGAYSIVATYSGDQIYASATSSVAILNIISNSSFGTENIGVTNSIPVTVTFSSDTTLGSIAVVTDGMQNLDFTNAGGGTCTTGDPYSSNSSCTVNVSFTPRFSGTRNGALVLSDNSGNMIQTIYLKGTGIGPQVAFQPAVSTAILAESSAACAQLVDSSGDIYVSVPTNGACGPITKWTPNSGNYTQSTVSSSALSNQIDIAVDGAGNLYIADTNKGRVLKETLLNGTYSESVIASGLSIPRLVEVDGNGEVYFVVGAYNGTSNPTLYEEVPSSSGVYTQTVISMNWMFADPLKIEIDDAGNFYVNDRETYCCDGNGANYYLYGVYRLFASYGSGFDDVTFGGENQVVSLNFMDANGNLYISGASGNYKYVLSRNLPDGWTTFPVTASGWGMDGSGNLYGTVDNVVTKVNFAGPPSLRFAQTDVGSKSSDSPRGATFENIGNAPLIFSVPGSGTNPSVSTNFALDPSTTCPQVGTSGPSTSLATNASCNYAVNFTPTTTGTIDGSLIAIDNALNTAGGTQSIPLSGSGTSGGVGMAVLTIGPGGVLQGKMVPNLTPAGMGSSGNVWVDTTHRTLVQGAVYLQLDSQGNPTCNVYPSQTQLTITRSPRFGTLLLGTEPHYIQGCGTKPFPFQVARYIWGADQSVEQDPFTLKFSTADLEYQNPYSFIAELARVTVSPAAQTGSGSNPPLTATATLTNPPTSATGFNWEIVGGNGAIVFPNGQLTMSSTTNSISIEEPSPTPTTIPFDIKVGVQYPSTPPTSTAEDDPLLYGPANDVFCGTPTITSISPNIWFAGQSYNITITGTGFNPTASQSCAQSNVMVSMANGGKVSTTVTAITPTQITATVTPAAADSTGGATVAIVGAPTPAPNADVLEVPVITWTSDPDGSSPTISGPNATLPNPSAVVGQQILLTTTPTAATLATLPVQVTLATANPPTIPNPWTVGGTNIGGYNPSTASASVTATVLTNPGTTALPMTIYWVYSGNGSVTYQYCVTSPQLTAPLCSPSPATATFAVSGPSGGTMSISSYSPVVTTADLNECITSTGTYPGGPYLLYGEGATGLACPGYTGFTQFGIAFAAPSGYANASSGTFQLVQLISTDSINSTSDPAGLDTQYPYAAPPTDDNPSLFLGTNPASVTHTFVANMFLMWKSNTTNSIWVPLGYQTWGFTGSATCSSSCGTAANWAASTSGTPGPEGNFTPSSASQSSVGNNTLVDGYPTWSVVSK